MNTTELKTKLPTVIGDALINCDTALGEVTCEVVAADIKHTCVKLRDELQFETLVDLCGMDYSAWGKSDGDVDRDDGEDDRDGDGKPDGDGNDSRFAVVYHLLSLHHNLRLRLRVRLGESPAVDSVTEVWACANWYEREAFDLFGILFHGHPDLRRLLTDYGFIGHPMRKDFPLSGQVEMRYDEEQGRVIYQPVTIEPRILVPRTIGGAPRTDEKP